MPCLAQSDFVFVSEQVYLYSTNQRSKYKLTNRSTVLGLVANVWFIKGSLVINLFLCSIFGNLLKLMPTS